MAVLLSINPTNLTPSNGRAVSPITLGGGRQISNGTKSVRLLAYPNGRSINGSPTAPTILDFWTKQYVGSISAIGAFVLAIALPSSLKAPGVPGDLGWNAFHVRAGSGTLSQNVYSDSGTSATGKAMFAAGGWQYTGSPAIIDGSWHVYIATWKRRYRERHLCRWRPGGEPLQRLHLRGVVLLDVPADHLKTRLDGVAQSGRSRMAGHCSERRQQIRRVRSPGSAIAESCISNMPSHAGSTDWARRPAGLEVVSRTSSSTTRVGVGVWSGSPPGPAIGIDWALAGRAFQLLIYTCQLAVDDRRRAPVILPAPPAANMAFPVAEVPLSLYPRSARASLTARAHMKSVPPSHQERQGGLQ